MNQHATAQELEDRYRADREREEHPRCTLPVGTREQYAAVGLVGRAPQHHADTWAAYTAKARRLGVVH